MEQRTCAAWRIETRFLPSSLPDTTFLSADKTSIIPYTELSTDARREVWANFIQQIGEHEFEPFSDHDLEGLSKLDINGREIKNLVKGALLLAREDDTRVTIGYLHTLAKMRLRAKQVLSE